MRIFGWYYKSNPIYIMNRKIFLYTLLAFPFILTVFQGCKEKVETELRSPNGNLVIAVSSQESGEDPDPSRLIYTVFKQQSEIRDTLIQPSPLGIKRKDEDFIQNLELVSQSEEQTIEQEYTLTSGKSRNISFTANQTTLTYKNKNDSKIKLQLRAFNTGIAFRYIFPGNGKKEYTVTGESTGFHLPETGKVWIQPYDGPSQTTPAYERYFQNAIDIGTEAPDQYGWAFPALFHTKDHWMLISESDVDTGYCGTHLNPGAKGGLYTIQFPSKGERFGTGKRHPSSGMPWEMPWRFIIIGEDLGTIVESNQATHLASPSRLTDTSWIEPGVASWSWWSYHGSRSVGRLKQYVDLAVEMDWKYSLVDAGWPDMEDGNIQEVIRYADQKDIGLFLWYNSGGRTNNYKRDQYVMLDPQLRKKEMKKLQKWGIKGVKIDFFNSDKQHMIQLYHDILKDAAKYKLMVNFHGCTLPRGWRRTYPNLMTMEAIKGAENYRYDESYTDRAPSHNTIAALTRNIIGPMDYTPCTFSNNRYPHQTTFGHELALSVLYESGIQHMADKAGSYLSLSEAPKNFLKAVPAAWDETRFITGIPGETGVIARRKGDSWYIGGINGTSENRDIQIETDFLDSEREYDMTVITDGEQSETFHTESRNIAKDQSFQVSLKANGGFVARLQTE